MLLVTSSAASQENFTRRFIDAPPPGNLRDINYSLQGCGARMSAGRKLKEFIMKLVICLVAGFVLSLSSLTSKSERSSVVKYSHLTRIHQH